MRTLADQEHPMRKLLAIAAALAVCAGPAVAQAHQPARDCNQDPETTGALPADPRSLYMPGERPVRTDSDPPEVSWQDEAQGNSEQRRRDLLACGVD
ncbi:hypothetical protein [Methylobacterium longum]|nr:hypothetical protein [Methylobacterium longum]